MSISDNKISVFQQKIWDFYKKNKRAFAWRETTDPYKILLSEIMLQQTQTTRVKEKYKEFLEKFPTVKDLASASLENVLKTWIGMGYNRRARYLYDAAKMVTIKYNGIIPKTVEELDELPGIGFATASAIATFAYNVPVVFIETNIRRVFIHSFFNDRVGVEDAELMPIIERALNSDKSRDWYYALMDYGAYLGKLKDNPNKKSKHYSLQSPFIGSDRQIRGKILKLLLLKNYSKEKLIKILDVESDRLVSILNKLVKDKMIKKNSKSYGIYSNE